MHTTAMYQDGRPITFQQWLAIRDPGHTCSRETCDCCGEGEPISPDALCLACLKYQFGHDQAREEMLTAMIGGAVRAALEAGASPGEIFKAAADAMDVHHADLTREVVAGVVRADRTRKAVS